MTSVSFLAPCDRCGQDGALWHGVPVPAGIGPGGTEYTVDCPGCDKAWTVAAQLQRAIERRAA